MANNSKKKVINNYTYGNDALNLKVSNEMSYAKYHMSGMEQDIFNIAMTRIQHSQDGDTKRLHARLFPTDINRILQKGKNLYRDLPIIAKNLTGHSAIVQTRDGFVAFAIVTKAVYENCVLDIEFSDELENHFLNLSSNFNTRNIAIEALMSGYAKSLYHVLNEKAYLIPPKENTYTFDIRISELKFMMGCVDVDEPKIRKYMSQNDTIDWDYLYDNIAIDKKYERFCKFKIVLDKAQKEVNEKSNLTFEYEVIKEGNRKRIIRFILHREEPLPQWRDKLYEIATGVEIGYSQQYKSMYMIGDETYNNLYEMYEGHNYLSRENIDAFVDLSVNACKSRGNYSNEEVTRNIVDAIEYTDKKPHVSDYVAYISYMIRTGISQPIEVVDGSAEQAQEIREIQKEYENNKEKVAENVWNKSKDKEDFEDFVYYLENNIGISLEELELAKTATECYKIYIDWKLKRGWV